MDDNYIQYRHAAHQMKAYFKGFQMISINCNNIAVCGRRTANLMDDIIVSDARVTAPDTHKRRVSKRTTLCTPQLDDIFYRLSYVT